MTQKPDVDAMKAFNKAVIDEFRANGGKLSGDADRSSPSGLAPARQFVDAHLLLLTTTGAKSGEPRLSPLAYLNIDDKTIIIGSYAGADAHPAWVHNLRANPRASIEIGTDSYDVIARELPPAEREEIFPRVIDAAPGFAGYQAKTDRVIPLFELQRMST